MYNKEVKVNLVHFQDLGKIDYQEAWDLQESLLRLNVGLKKTAGNKTDPHKVPTQHHLLFCEHQPVYTLGKSGKTDHLLLNTEQMAERGIAFYKINRGGDITYHGPGQITGYPIFDLEKFRRDIGWYLRSMEEVMIQLLADYGLKGGRIAGETGVWLHTETPFPKKICAFGVRASRWVTMHGFALNVNTNLEYFNFIVPCGIADKGVTSIQAELGRKVDMKTVKAELKETFAKVFGYSYAP